MQTQTDLDLEPSSEKLELASTGDESFNNQKRSSDEPRLWDYTQWGYQLRNLDERKLGNSER